MPMKTYQLSPLPRPTWGWLNLNEAELSESGEGIAYTGRPFDALPDGVTADTGALADASVSSIAAETAKYVRRHVNYNLELCIRKDCRVSEPLVLNFELDGLNSRLVDRLHIRAEAGSQATVLLRCHADGQEAHSHWGHLSLDIGEGADLTLICVQMLGRGDNHASGIQADVRAGGRLNLLLAELGGGRTVSACDVNLSGEGARAELNGLYTAGGRDDKDLNYRIVFQGRDTQGDISVRGVLSGQGRKVLKSTLDFLTGASGAKGSEAESVLILSDKAVNISTPLLLCREDDVEGQHATNISRPNPGQLYYLMSRGFSEREARKLLVEASFLPLLAGIPSEEIRSEITAYIQEVTGDGT